MKLKPLAVTAYCLLLLADTQAVAGEVPAEHLCALCGEERLLDRFARARLAEEGDAAAAARAADLRPERAALKRRLHQRLHVRRRDVGREPLAVGVGRAGGGGCIAFLCEEGGRESV